MFERSTELGGNFIDTADHNVDGRAEEMVGTFVAARESREWLAITVKTGSATGTGAQLAVTLRDTCEPHRTGRSSGCAPTSPTFPGCMSGTA